MWSDWKVSLRGLRRSPGFTVVAVVTLGLGIGASTAMFSVVDAVLLRPLAYPAPEQLVRVWEEATSWGFPENTPSPANYLDWKAEARSFSHVSGFRRWPSTIEGGGEPRRVEGMKSDAALFGMLGARAEVGRVFTEGENVAGAAAVVVLGHALWRDAFAGDRSIVGRTIQVEGEARTVIGVMPAGFEVPGFQTDIWMPLGWSARERARRGSHFMQVMARLKPGVTVEQAGAEMRALARRLEREYPATNTGVGAVVKGLREQLTGRERPMLAVLLGAVGLLLAIACANVAGLMVARGSGRGRELAVRSAMGAGRGDLIRLQMAESAWIAAAGCGMGVAFAAWTRDTVAGLLPATLHGARAIELNGQVLGFAVALGGLTAVLAGLAPALVASKVKEAEALRQAGRGATAPRVGLRRMLVAGEVALSAALLCGAALFLQSFLKLRREELGFDPRGLVTMRVEPPGARYGDDTQLLAFYRRVLDRVRAVPGLGDAGWTYRLPTTMAGGASAVTFDGRPAPAPGQELMSPHRYVSASYFGTMRMELVEGRWMEARDTAGPLFGVMVNEAFVRRFLKPGGALGATFTNSNEGARCRVVGVVKDVREYAADEAARTVVYLPMEANPMVRDLVVRTGLEAGEVAAAVRREVRAVDAGVAVSHVQTMEEILGKAVAGPRLEMVLSGVFAALALLIAGVGLGGVAAQSVVERTAEIGLRVALGARRGDVLRLVVRQGLAPAGAGLAVGLLMSVALGRGVEALLYGVRGVDAGVLGMVAVGVVGLAVVALAGPAWRAMRIEPMRALRGD